MHKLEETTTALLFVKWAFLTIDTVDILPSLKPAKQVVSLLSLELHPVNYSLFLEQEEAVGARLTEPHVCEVLVVAVGDQDKEIFVYRSEKHVAKRCVMSSKVITRLKDKWTDKAVASEDRCGCRH